MKVRLRESYAKMYPEFTPGNVYRVLETSSEYHRIFSDAGEPALWPTRAFVVVDPRRAPDWVDTRDEDGDVSSSSPAFDDPPYLFEKWFDYDMRARQKLAMYMNQLCHAEAAALPDAPNTYLRVTVRSDAPTEPLVRYLELDEERFELRKVEHFRTGRYTWASVRGGWSGTTRLGEMAVPILDEINQQSELSAVEIDRATFEAAFAQCDDDD